MNFKSTISKLESNRFFINVLIVSGGTLFSQVFTIITTPVVTRIYSTDEYGILTTFNSILSIMGIAGALKYEMSIPIANSEDDARQCFKLSLLILFFSAFFIFICILLGGIEFLKIFGAENIYKYRYVVPVGVFLVQYFAIVIQYAYRQRDFKRISTASIKQSCIGNTVKIILGLLNFGSIGLLISRIMSDSLGSISLTKLVFDKKENGGSSGNKLSLKEIAIRYKKFPLVQFPSTIIGQIILNLPVFYLGKMFNNSILGSFGLANNVANLSMDLVGKSVGNVFYAEAAKIAKTDPIKLKSLSNSIIWKMAILGLFPLLILLFFGEYLFGFVFGQKWLLSGTFASILSIGIYISFVFTPISRVFEVYEIQGYGLVLNSIYLLLSFAVFFISNMMNYSIHLTLFCYTIVKSIFSLAIFAVSRHFINKQINCIEH